MPSGGLKPCLRLRTSTSGRNDASGLAQQHLALVGARAHPGRDAQGEVDQLVVEERHPGLHAVGHRHLVLDDEQAVQECALLEVEGLLDRLEARVEVGGDLLEALARTSTPSAAPTRRR